MVLLQGVRCRIVCHVIEFLRRVSDECGAREHLFEGTASSDHRQLEAMRDVAKASS